MLKKSLIFGVVFFYFGLINPVLAVDAPDFPICTNISATVKVSFSEGTHGIPGKYEVYSGSDVVYQLTPDTLTQCFCPKEGNEGIQTNWWKMPQSEGDIGSLKAQDWIYIPSGALWGLDPTSYLAKNSNYICKTTTTTSGGGGGSAQGGGAAGTVLGVGGGVLGLAATGNIVTILSLIIAGISSLLLGIILKKRSV